MARGITETDVFTACDALLLAGARPTIERVRQKIGRGSPNTVSPMLDTWFKSLGRRLQDPGVFEAQPGVPDPVLQVALHFWEVAQAEARRDFDDRLAERLRATHAELEQARQAVAAALADKEVEIKRTRAVQQQLDETEARLDAVRLGQAASAARAEVAQAQLADQRRRLEAAEAQARDSDERARRESQAAHDRATGAERRAALEIENERTARSRTEKRAEALEKRFEGLQTESQAASAQHLRELVEMQSALDHGREELEKQCATNAEIILKLEEAEAALMEAKLATERANGEASVTRAAVERLELLLAQGKSNRQRVKATQQLQNRSHGA